MIRTQIQLTEAQARALRARARVEGVSLAALIRRSIDRMLQEGSGDRGSLYDEAATIIGRFRDRRRASDLAEAHDKYLDEEEKWNRVFVDTSAILALINPDDGQHSQARSSFARLKESAAGLVTTSYVLVEIHALLTRRMGLAAVEQFRTGFSPLLEVIWVDQSLHEAGLDLLMARRNRDLSLVDAVSFLVIRTGHFDGAFACDRHFDDEGIPTRF